MKQFAYTTAHPHRFLHDEDGAVTVDWVVLTAAIVMLGMAAGFTVTSNIPGIADKISSVVAGQDVGG
ncbi:hypothetical protein O2N63_08675 [Aliiroseovarius sp. KMU-50]|uniref:Pilus assembly protein n=1 Tax=Aliiroseovarius salicola TaxID=3009082 RepID=A0ABT4W0X6_9RHOB|nr:hypothetical protein [Aliiroseovarius sp. KMU-50]MDA5094162.1 hypothetical protein [Aliiroseovarius sp. KMU-50]